MREASHVCRYSSNVTHVWRLVRARGGGVLASRRACVCVQGGAGGGPHTGAGGQCPPTARRADIRHSRDTAVPRACLVSSLRVREPPATHVRAVLAPVATLDDSDANRAVLPNFPVTQCFRTRLLLKKNLCELEQNSAMLRLRSGGKAIL